MMSPDPSGGHFMNPQSLNRYAYVHNNPLSMIDPFGLDCVYVNDDETQATVQSGDCTSNTDNGIYVNGTVDPNSFSLTPGDNGNSLAFNYTNDDSGMSTLFQTGLPTLCANNSCAPWNLMNSGFNSNDALNPFAAQVFSQVYQNTQALTRPGFVPAFYGASALAGVGGQLATEFGPALASKLASLGPAAEQLGREILLNPQTSEFLSDFIQGYTPGAVPATWGGLAGFTASEIVSHWSQISQGVQNTYQQVRGSVPH